LTTAAGTNVIVDTAAGHDVIACDALSVGLASKEFAVSETTPFRLSIVLTKRPEQPQSNKRLP